MQRLTRHVSVKRLTNRRSIDGSSVSIDKKCKNGQKDRVAVRSKDQLGTLYIVLEVGPDPKPKLRAQVSNTSCNEAL